MLETTSELKTAEETMEELSSDFEEAGGKEDNRLEGVFRFLLPPRLLGTNMQSISADLQFVHFL